MFRIGGCVATHFAQMAGRISIQKSYEAILTILDVAGFTGLWDVVRGGDPMPYVDEPSDSDGSSTVLMLEMRMTCCGFLAWVSRRI